MTLANALSTSLIALLAALALLPASAAEEAPGDNGSSPGPDGWPRCAILFYTLDPPAVGGDPGCALPPPDPIGP